MVSGLVDLRGGLVQISVLAKFFEYFFLDMRLY